MLRLQLELAHRAAQRLVVLRLARAHVPLLVDDLRLLRRARKGAHEDAGGCSAMRKCQSPGRRAAGRAGPGAFGSRRRHLGAAHEGAADAPREGQRGVHLAALVDGGADREEEDDVVPLDLGPPPPPHHRRSRLSQEGFARLEQAELGDGERHARPPLERRAARRALAARRQPRDDVLDVLLDLARRLEAEELRKERVP
jgi:hypothetical protein